MVEARLERDAWILKFDGETFEPLFEKTRKMTYSDHGAEFWPVESGVAFWCSYNIATGKRENGRNYLMMYDFTSEEFRLLDEKESSWG